MEDLIMEPEAEAGKGTEGEGEGKEAGSEETTQTPAEVQGEIDLDTVFGEGVETKAPESSEEKETLASGEEVKETAKSAGEKEAGSKEGEVKEGSEEKSDELKAAEQVLADKKTADDLKEAYGKLSPEEKATADAATAKDTEIQTTLAGLKETVGKNDKRNQDTTRWAQGLSRDLAASRRENLILQKKIEDPDYDPAKDTTLDTGPSDEEKAEVAKQQGRADASLIAAYGPNNENKADVDRDLQEYRDTFAQDGMVQQQVIRSEMPIQEAISIVRLSKFFGEYGRDPKAIVATMTERLTKELTPKIREEETKSIMAGLKKTAVLPKGLSGVKGASTTEKEEKGTPAKERTLEDEFDNQ
jgi:hypothetical protein